MNKETILLDTNAFSRLMQGDEFVIRSADAFSIFHFCGFLGVERRRGRPRHLEQRGRDAHRIGGDLVITYKTERKRA